MIPKIRYPARIDYLDNGKLSKKIFKTERILVDGCHSETSGQNLYDYLKTLKVPIYGIWAMTKNKDPDMFIKQFKGIFKKIITVKIPNEKNSCTTEELKKIASNQNYETETAKDFKQALKKITSEIEKPVSLIIGGSKISTKIKIINNLIKKFNNIIIVGGMGNTMLKHTGSNIGKSICENDFISTPEEILTFLPNTTLG